MYGYVEVGSKTIREIWFLVNNISQYVWLILKIINSAPLGYDVIRFMHTDPPIISMNSHIVFLNSLWFIYVPTKSHILNKFVMQSERLDISI